MKIFFNTGVRIASSNLGTTRLQTLYVLCLNLGMGAKVDIGRFPSIGGLKDMEHNIGDSDFQRITAALLLPLQ